jgi:hypothetical protein
MVIGYRKLYDKLCGHDFRRLVLESFAGKIHHIHIYLQACYPFLCNKLTGLPKKVNNKGLFVFYWPIYAGAVSGNERPYLYTSYQGHTGRCSALVAPSS